MLTDATPKYRSSHASFFPFVPLSYLQLSRFAPRLCAGLVMMTRFRDRVRVTHPRHIGVDRGLIERDNDQAEGRPFQLSDKRYRTDTPTTQHTYIRTTVRTNHPADGRTARDNVRPVASRCVFSSLFPRRGASIRPVYPALSSPRVSFAWSRWRFLRAVHFSLSPRRLQISFSARRSRDKARPTRGIASIRRQGFIADIIEPDRVDPRVKSVVISIKSLLPGEVKDLAAARISARDASRSRVTTISASSSRTGVAVAIGHGLCRGAIKSNESEPMFASEGDRGRKFKTAASWEGGRAQGQKGNETDGAREVMVPTRTGTLPTNSS